MADTLPVPKRPARHNDWTREKMVVFLRELAASQSVAQAVKSVGMSRQSAYKLRNRLAGTPFALGWEVALEAGMQQLAHAVMDRALNGTEVPHYYHGELVGTSRRFDERLAMWLLENPWKVGRQQIAREYASEGFDALLERIEWASLDWEDGEPLPGRALAPAPSPGEEMSGEEMLEAFDNEEEHDPLLAAAAKDQEQFLAHRSWYASLDAPIGGQAGAPARRRGG